MCRRPTELARAREAFAEGEKKTDGQPCIAQLNVSIGELAERQHRHRLNLYILLNSSLLVATSGRYHDHDEEAFTKQLSPPQKKNDGLLFTASS